MRSLAIVGLSAQCCLQSLGADPGPGEWTRMAPILPRHYVCPRAASAPTIDGVLDDPAWRKAAWTEEFVDIEGSVRPKPAFRTRVKMLWDDQYFYIAAALDEPHVWGTITKHDAVIFQDNDFEVFIDPNGDNHEYYEFEVNALNTTWDLFLTKPYKDKGDAKNSWEIKGLKSAVHVNGTLNRSDDIDKSWSLEIAFPWEALGEFAHRPAPPGEGDQWRVNFSRVEWQATSTGGKYKKVPKQKEHNWVWSPIGIIDMHRPERWGYVQFTKSEEAVPFSADPALKIRDELHALYYAQNMFHGKTHRYTAKLADLDFSPSFPTKVELVGKGFKVTATLSLPGNKTQNWHIREDALTWCDDPVLTIGR